MTGSIVPWRWKKKRVPVGAHQDTVNNLQRQVNRLFNDVLASSSKLPDFVSEPLQHLGERLTSFTPNVNVRKEEGAIVVAVELPGMDERDVEISLTSEGLAIRGERKSDGAAVEGDQWSYSESEYGPFERIVPLDGLRVKSDGVEATASKGIVTITLPIIEARADEPETRVEIRSVG